MAISGPTRRQLEYFTVLYNSAEGLVSIVAGLIAGSVSLVALRPGQHHRSVLRGGFGLAAPSRSRPIPAG